jgi:hypothetical protein
LDFYGKDYSRSGFFVALGLALFGKKYKAPIKIIAKVFRVLFTREICAMFYAANLAENVTVDIFAAKLRRLANCQPIVSFHELKIAWQSREYSYRASFGVELCLGFYVCLVPFWWLALGERLLL